MAIEPYVSLYTHNKYTKLSCIIDGLQFARNYRRVVEG